jgi:hypothetical protein
LRCSKGIAAQSKTGIDHGHSAAEVPWCEIAGTLICGFRMEEFKSL